MVIMNERLNFELIFKILINPSLNNSMWPVVIVLDRVALECWSTLAPNMRVVTKIKMNFEGFKLSSCDLECSVYSINSPFFYGIKIWK